jgi:hypothetical protein
MRWLITKGALIRHEHRIDPHSIFEAVRLLHCVGCGRIWRNVKSDDQYFQLLAGWLDLVEPTGFTSTAEMPDAPNVVDMVAPLSETEMLLWDTEPCPGSPGRDYPGTIENAAYRLMALGVLRPDEFPRAALGVIPQSSDVALRNQIFIRREVIDLRS